MPILRTRVPRELVRKRWLGVQGAAQLVEELADFKTTLQADEESLIKVVNDG